MRRTVLAAAIAAVLAGGGIALVLRDHGHAGAGAVASQAPTTTAAALANAGQAPPANAKPSASPASAAPVVAGWWHSPEAGTYRYHFDRQGTAPATYDGTAIVTGSANTYAETRDHLSAKLQRSFAVAQDGLRETSFTLESATGNDVCRWDHPMVVIPASPKKGATWTATATCSLTVGTATADVVRETTSRVVGPKQAKIGSISGTLLRIDRVTTTRTTSGGKTVVRHSSSIEYFDTARGLLAQSTEDNAEDAPGGRFTYRVIETLLTLQPEVHR